MKTSGTTHAAVTVPLLDLKGQNAKLDTDLRAVFEKVLRSGIFILGPELEAFERECASYLGVRHAVGVSSGTDAILLALMAHGVGPGDEVIVPSFTFFATAGCVARTGATPVFCDVCPCCFNMRPHDIEPLLSPRTRAVIPVHLFGQAAPIEELTELVQGRSIAVIEDAAQAFGAERGGKKVGGLGTFGAFSFFPSKNLGGFGDSGLLTTQDDELAAKAKMLRMHGMEPKYYHPLIGGNFRMDALQAALLRVKLPHLDGYCQGRARHAAHYIEALSSLQGVALACQDCSCGARSGGASEKPRITLPCQDKQHRHIWNQFTLRVHGEGQRDALRAYLIARGIGAEIYYPVPLHKQDCFSHLPAVTLPESECLATEVLSLPVFPELEQRQQEAVIEAIRDFLNHSS